MALITAPDPTKPPIDPNAQNIAQPTTPAVAANPATTAVVAPAAAPVAKWDVAPEQSVQSQIKNIIADNSPLMQQAETRAKQAMNNRGLLNSSMAVGAGQEAVIAAAAPIAGADAATYATAAQFNAGEANKSNLQLMDSENKIRLSEINTSYQGLVASSNGASQLYDTYQKAINAILTNKDMNAPNKQAAINAQLGMMQAGMKMYSDVEGLNTSALLDFSNAANITAGGQPGALAAPGPATTQAQLDKAAAAKAAADAATAKAAADAAYAKDHPPTKAWDFWSN